MELTEYHKRKSKAALKAVQEMQKRSKSPEQFTEQVQKIKKLAQETFQKKS